MLNFFIGSYTKMISPNFGGCGEGIYSVSLNTKTGELKVLHKTKIVNPAYLAVSSDNKYLYTVTEVLEQDIPKVVAFKINEDFSLKFINEQLIEGDLPCHITYSHSSVLVSCYGSGNVLQFPILDNGELKNCAKNYTHRGKSINLERQERPHAHQSVVLSNNIDVLVPDLGIDKLKAYYFKDSILYPKSELDINIKEGEGPRHVVFTNSGAFGFVIGELTGNVSLLKLENDSYKCVQNYNTLPDSFIKTPSASAIRLHPNNSFLYVANRELEAISFYEFSNDKLNFIDIFYTKGRTIREFNITPDGKKIIACHQDSHDIIVYDLSENGKLKEVYRTKEILSSVCVTFIRTGS